MKYNKSEIMKRAWEINRKLQNSFSEALKMSWKMAKAEIEIKEDWNEPDGTITFNVWANYGKVRAYYNCSWRSKHSNRKSSNYINLVA